ncbi:Hypothetical predicted protein [Lecanosticta acicola]|uniref:Uncharacterized protein n=1 Tax=Lecanosticta acicola TaxID=111012 RepID=A0AAI8YUD5_9PEZI|nr:Hypothetical predicted protein [Lecanosticta acicola]
MQYKLIVAALTSVLAVGVSAMPAPEAAPNALALPVAAPEVVEHAPLEARSEMSDMAAAQKAYIQATLDYAAKAKEFKQNGGLQKWQQEKHQKRAEQAGQWYGPQGYYSGSNGFEAQGTNRQSGQGFGISLLGLPLLSLDSSQYGNAHFYDVYGNNQYGGSS